MGGELRERVRTRGQVRVRVEYSAEGAGGFHCCASMSLGHGQGRARRGTYSRGQPYHASVPGHPGGVLIAC